MAELWDYCVVAEALGARHLLLVLDAWKEDVVLLRKGRHAEDDELIGEHDLAKLASFLGECGSVVGRAGQQSALKTEAQVSAVVADLHAVRARNGASHFGSRHQHAPPKVSLALF